MGRTPLQLAHEQRDNAMVGHGYAVNLLRERDREIQRLRDNNARAIRQNCRLSSENAALAARLREVSPGDAVLMQLLEG